MSRGLETAWLSGPRNISNDRLSVMHSIPSTTDRVCRQIRPDVTMPPKEGETGCDFIILLPNLGNTFFFLHVHAVIVESGKDGLDGRFIRF